MRGAALLLLALLAPLPAAAQTFAARDIPRGTVLTAADLRVAAGGSQVQPGWIARRVIKTGEVLRPPAVAPARMVRQGQTVHVLLRHEGIALSVEGQATGGGDLGDEIVVRLGPNRRIAGVISGPGQVTARDAQRSS